MAKTGKDKKKKGPKGKKARAKAKLERQWGETAVEEVKPRHGKSRLHRETATAPRTTKVTEPVVEEEPGVDGSTSDDDSQSEVGNDNGAFNSFLDSIRGKQPTYESSDDDNVDEEAGDDEMSDQDALDSFLLDFDPFTERFMRAPLPEDEDKRQQELAKLQSMSTKNTPLDIATNTSLVWQTSNVLWSKLKLKGDSLTKNDLQTRSLSFFKANRELLKQAWPKGTKFDPAYSLVASYADVLLTTETSDNRQSLSDSILLHILNHVLTTRSRIFKHNRRLAAAEEDDDMDDDNMAWKRDQGFTRPTVVVLLPTRGCCHRLVHRVLELLNAGEPEAMERFETEYGPPPQEDTEEVVSPQVLRHRKKVLQQKGKEWKELFGDNVNDDDDFKMGIAINTKANKKKEASESSSSVKLYADFYRSDVILASPLALKMACDGERGADFLSSIEICHVSRADVLLMQNWDHVNDILGLLNQRPKQTTDTDFSRVRNYLLADQSAYWRQLIVTSSFLDPLILSAFKRHAKSVDGWARIRRKYAAEGSSLANVLLPTRQVFQRVTSKSFAQHGEDRVKYLVEKVLPPILDSNQKHTMLFIPSYFDFIAVRNALLRKEVEFVTVSEYSRTSETSRGRARFLQGHKPLLLYTGRAHFFLRHAIKGVRHLIMVGLPEYADFYAAHVNRLNDGLEDEGVASCLALFTKYDAQALERIVGTSNCSRMIGGDKTTYFFG